MSVQLMSRVWELDLPQNEKLILLAFADHADDDGLAFPSIARIAWKSGYSERQTRAIVRGLRDRNILEELGGHAGGRGRSTAYRIHPENHANLAPFSFKNPAVDRRETLQSATQKGAKSCKKRERINKQPSVTITEPSVFTRSARGKNSSSSAKGGQSRAEQRLFNNLAAAGY